MSDPKILWAILDPNFTFTPHIQSVYERDRSRLNVLKSLAGSTWGQQKETLLITYKALIKSVLTYASAIWLPNSSQTSIGKVQSIQNSALRIAPGSHKIASVSHSHCETEILPVADSLSVLCRQLLASAPPPPPFLPPCHADKGAQTNETHPSIPLPSDRRPPLG